MNENSSNIRERWEKETSNHRGIMGDPVYLLTVSLLLEGVWISPSRSCSHVLVMLSLERSGPTGLRGPGPEI